MDKSIGSCPFGLCMCSIFSIPHGVIRVMWIGQTFGCAKFSHVVWLILWYGQVRERMRMACVCVSRIFTHRALYNTFKLRLFAIVDLVLLIQLRYIAYEYMERHGKVPLFISIDFWPIFDFLFEKCATHSMHTWFVPDTRTHHYSSSFIISDSLIFYHIRTASTSGTMHHAACINWIILLFAITWLSNDRFWGRLHSLLCVTKLLTELQLIEFFPNYHKCSSTVDRLIR